MYKYISLRICGIVFLYEYISLRICGIVFCTHINLYHKYFVLVSDKYGDEGLVMLKKCIFLKEEFQITQEEGFLIKNGNFGESSCHDGQISLSFRPLMVWVVWLGWSMINSEKPRD